MKRYTINFILKLEFCVNTTYKSYFDPYGGAVV